MFHVKTRRAPWSSQTNYVIASDIRVKVTLWTASRDLNAETLGLFFLKLEKANFVFKKLFELLYVKPAI